MKQRSLLILHRRMGLISALFLMLLSLTGLVLHYSVGLRLDSRFIDSRALVSWYGIELPEFSASFAAADRRLSQLENRLFFDSTALPGNFPPLRGLAPTDFGFAAASSNQLILLTDEGDIVEVLDADYGVPAPIERLASNADGELYLEVGSDIWQADPDSLQFQALVTAPATLVWSEASVVPDNLQQQILADYAASLITWERLLLDIHSGRILGNLGVILVDVMAILFFLMAATGIWIWSRRRP
jgi:hypothetical protein